MFKQNTLFDTKPSTALDPNNYTQKSVFSQNSLDIAKYQQPAQTQEAQAQVKQSGWDKFKTGFKNQMAHESENKGFGASNWAQTGINALGTIANIGIGIGQYNLAKKNLEETIKQRQIENQRYEEQKKRHIQATDDAASTAGGLKSANMDGPKEEEPRMARD